MAKLTEKDIRQIAERAIEQLGHDATPDNIRKVVEETVRRFDDGQARQVPERAQSSLPPTYNRRGDRVIVTAFGKNRKGILAGLTGSIADAQCDIIDLSQKILQEFFTVMILIDISTSEHDFDAIKQRLVDAGSRFDLKVVVQHEEIFKAMHRV